EAANPAAPAFARPEPQANPDDADDAGDDPSPDEATEGDAPLHPSLLKLAGVPDAPRTDDGPALPKLTERQATILGEIANKIQGEPVNGSGAGKPGAIVYDFWKDPDQSALVTARL